MNTATYYTVTSTLKGGFIICFVDGDGACERQTFQNSTDLVSFLKNYHGTNSRDEVSK